MNIMSHYRMAKGVKRFLEREAGIRLHRGAFIFGNLKPDLIFEFLWRPHTTDRLDEIFLKLTDFLNNAHSETIGKRAFDMKLGEFCHYVSDFFCYPHNSGYHENMWRHHLYEWRLSGRLKRQSPPVSKRDAVVSPRLMEQTLRHMHTDYSAQTQGMENDIAYIPAACCFLALSAVSARAGEKLPATLDCPEPDGLLEGLRI